jgi:hypothetical protein
MLDVFANRPESRKITDLAAVVEAGRRWSSITHGWRKENLATAE